MVPAEAVTALNEGLAAVATVAALAFIIVVSIAAFRYMRSAVGSEQQSGESESEYFDRLVESEKDSGVDESLNQGFDETDDQYGDRLELREIIREDYGVKN